MATATWAVYVDWDGSGSFTDDARKDLNGDHTSTTAPRKVKQININRGKSSDFSRYVAGHAQVVVSNPLGYFDSESPGAIAADGSVLGIRTTLANNQPVVDNDRFFATPTAAGQAYAQSFVNGATRLVDRIDLRMKRTGSPGGTMTATIYTDSSNLPSAVKDNYSVSRAVAISSVSTSYGWVMFTFERPVVLLASTTYHVVVTTSGYTRSAGVNELSWAKNGATGFSGGHASSYNGTAWSWLDNGIANPSFETNTTGWSALGGSTITRITTDGYDGSACLQIDPPGAVGTEGALCGAGATAASASTAYTFRVAVKGTAGRAYRLAWDENNGGAYLRTKTSAAQTLVGSDWNWFELSATTGASVTSVNIYIYHDAVNSTRFFIDKAQFSADSSPQGDFKFRVTSNDVQVGRRCWIVATYNGTDYPLFYGRLKSVKPSVAADAQEATLLFEDLFAEFAEKEISLTMRTNRIVADHSAGSAITDVLTDMGVTSSNWSVGDEDEVIPYLFFNRMTGQQALEELTAAFCGFHFIKPAPAGTHWRYIWRSRHYEYTATPEETWDRTLYQDMTVDHPLEHQDVYNRITAAGNPRKVGAVTDIWQYGTLGERWSASEQRTIRAEYTDPAISVTTPVSGTDYPSGWTVNVSAFATYADLTVTAPASPSILTELKIRGVPVTAQPQASATVNDTETQAAYAVMYGGDGILVGPNMDSDFHQSYAAAHRYASTMVQRNKRKFPDLYITRSNRQGYPSILEREVGDMVTVTSGTIGEGGRTNIGVNGTYMIESIEHDVTDGGMYHFTRYRLRKAGVVSSHLWVLGESALGSTTVLAP